MTSGPPVPPLTPDKPPRHPSNAGPYSPGRRGGNNSNNSSSVRKTPTHHHHGQNSFASLEELMSKDDQAERGLLHSIENRRTTAATAGGDYWRASVQGERPPLGGAVPLDHMAMALERNHSVGGGSSLESEPLRSLAGGSQGSSQNSATKLADIARRMRQKVASSHTAAAGGNSSSSGSHTASSFHQRGPSRAYVILDSIQEQPELTSNEAVFDGVLGTSGSEIPDHQTNTTTTELDQATTSTDRLLTGAMQVEDLFDDHTPGAAAAEVSSVEIEPTVSEEMGGVDQEEHADEFVPLMKNPSFHSYQQQSIHSHEHGQQHSIGSPKLNKQLQNNSPKLLRQQSAAKKRKVRLQRFVWTWCHPIKLLQRIWHLLWHQSFILTIAVPCFATAWICFFLLDNPHVSFLPGEASVSWWLNFMGQQVLVLEVARIWQWCFIDKLVLGTRMAVQCLGPLLTLVFIQARGYPFCMASWGFLDLILLEGSNSIERFTGTYLQGNGGAILSSDIYARLLLSMILAGCATAVKRTAVAMYFGRRTFMEFKPRLEKLLKDVVLVSELAALAEEAEIAASEEEKAQAIAANRPSKVKFLGDVSWTNKPRRRRSSKAGGGGMATQNRPGSNPVTPAASADVSDSDDDDDDDASEITTQNDIRPAAERHELHHNESGPLRIKELMDHWDEPINKMDKSLNTSISDILRFRRALTFMDDDHPFGELFGPASTRDQLITSAHDVYHRLLNLTPGRNKLSCDFYDMLALEDDGETVNNGKRKALRKLFRPDANNELSLLAFVQCCDSLYKKLRYFRANVGNASVIDHALESIVDGAFTFILVLVLLSVMRINPWPLLVSISTLLVSVSFAVGSSASKWFEGMLLVAARRPYDLGDRIYMNDPSIIITDGLWYCWFVEDINLFHTTVRYAGTNEVATINNGSVANMRIINGARSPNAAVWFQFAYRPTLMEDGNLEKVKAALEQYAWENPRNWHSFSYFRVDEVHPDLEKLVVTIGMQHRSAWQDLVRILEAKAAIMCWLMEYSRKLGILYDELPRRELMYYAGSLKDGAVRQHRFQLHNPSNITGDSIPFASSQHDKGIEQMIPHSRDPSDATFLQQLQHSHGAK